MFPSHQRRDRSRPEPASYSSPSIPVQQSQQSQQSHMSHYPSNPHQSHNPQQHFQQPNLQPQGFVDSSNHSNLSGNSGHSQTFPSQHQAPYPKWTPPTPPASIANLQPQNQYQQNEYQHEIYQTQDYQHHEGGHIQQQVETLHTTETEEPVPGQQGYEWKPPAALQAFQDTSSPLNTPPAIEEQKGEQTNLPTETTVFNNDNQQEQEEMHDLDQNQVAESGFTDFLMWGKLEDPVDLSEILLNDPNIVTVADINGNTFLHAACDVGNISMVQFFLKNFPVDSAAALQTPNSQGFEPIHMAAFGGMLHVIGLLLKFDPSLAYRRTKSGSTVLHLAVANSNFQLVDFLLDMLDDECIWALNDSGSNALHLACKFGNVAMIDRLAGLPSADVNFRNTVDDTSCAELVCHNFDETMQVLVSSGAKLQATTAVDLVGPKMKALLSVKKSPSRRLSGSQDSNDTSSSLYSATKLRKSGISLVEEVVEQSPVTSPETQRRKSSSYFPPTNASFVPPPSADSTSAKNPKDLLKKDSGPKSKGKKINNAKSWIKSSVSGDDGAIVKVSAALKKDATLNGADISEPDVIDSEEVQQETTSHDVTKDSEDVVEIESKNDDDELFGFVEECKIPSLEAVLGVFPTILRDVNTIRRNDDGMHLLHVAAKCGSLDVAQYLVEGLGADVNVVDDKKRSPLHYASESCQLILVRYLVKYCGCELDTKDSEGKVALDLLPSEKGEDRDEIDRIIQKSAKKAPAKRLKVTVPKFNSP